MQQHVFKNSIAKLIQFLLYRDFDSPCLIHFHFFTFSFNCSSQKEVRTSLFSCEHPWRLCDRNKTFFELVQASRICRSFSADFLEYFLCASEFAGIFDTILFDCAANGVDVAETLLLMMPWKGCNNFLQHVHHFSRVCTVGRNVSSLVSWNQHLGKKLGINMSG